MENLFGEEYTDIPKPRKVDTANLNAAIHDILVKYDVLADTLLQATDGTRTYYDKRNPRAEIEIANFNEDYEQW